MNVTNKTTRTFDIFDITEDQAHDLLSVACKIQTRPDDQGAYIQLTGSEMETLNNLRKALLATGLTKKGAQDAG